MNDKTSFAKQVWDTLSALDVSAMVEKKGQLNYLSWANAWTSLMEVYPDSSFAFLDDSVVSGGTVEVRVSVTVASDGNELTRIMTLPVMDYKMKSFSDPTTRDISDARMRCLVKCIALFGLGLFLYRGEDIPQQREEAPKVALATSEQKDTIQNTDDEHIPPRRLVWLQTGDNFNNMSAAQARTIIGEIEQLKENK